MTKEQEKAIYRLNLGKNIPISSECCIVNVKDIETVLSMLEEQDKIIDLMLEEISKNILNTCPLEDYNYDLDCENKCNDNYKECWKQYFENKAKELLNK